MKHIMIAVLLFLSASVAAQDTTTAFVNVNVVGMMSDETVDASRTVIVEGDRIAAIGPVETLPVPQGAVVVDGTDRYLVPGLAEMHGHVPGADSADLERVLSLYVANGVTTVRGMLGQPSHLELRNRLANGEILGPRLITSGPSFNGRSVSSPENAVAMVRAQHAEGYDFLKIHPGLTRAEFDAIAETANALGIPFAGHVPEDVGVPRALAAGIATIDHLDGYMETLLPANEDPSGGLGGFFGLFIADQADAGRIEDIAVATANAGVWNVPTESLFEHVTAPWFAPDELFNRPEMRYMPAATVEQWRTSRNEVLGDINYNDKTARKAVELRQKLIVSLYEAGAGLLLGSDSPQIFNVPGFSLHHELEYLVDAGLSPYAALQSGTGNAARFFGSEAFGRVAEGVDADLILLDADPLADIGNIRRIHGVMVRGRWLPRAELDALLSRFER